MMIDDEGAWHAQETNERQRFEEEHMKVYKAMADVMADLAKVGVSKSQYNKQQGFAYRGVDDVMNALAPSMAKHGLLVIPNVIERTVTERPSKSGGTLFHTILRVRYSFVAAEDGSKHETEVLGEAMDSGDKATNKAMAVAYKYACFQAFCIPLVGVDPDAETHEVADPPLTAEQVQRLQVIVDETETDLKRFCGYFKVASLAELPSSRFEEAVKALETKRRRVAA